MHANHSLSFEISSLLWIAEPALSIVALIIMARRKSLRNFLFLSIFLAVHALSFLILYPLLNAHALNPLFSSLRQRYAVYFYFYWGFYLVEAIVAFLVIRELFRLAIEPLARLRDLGMVAFRWVVGISVVVALAASISPNMSSSRFIVSAATELERCQSILQLCLLLFLFTLARPLGLSKLSRIFGVSLGFGILAASDLINSAWFSAHPGLYSVLNLAHGLALSVVLIVWSTAFILPEPARRTISVPASSFLLRWNEVAKVLGKNPGQVIVSDPERLVARDAEAMAMAHHAASRTA